MKKCVCTNVEVVAFYVNVTGADALDRFSLYTCITVDGGAQCKVGCRMYHNKIGDISLYHTVIIKDEQRFWKRILIVDDEADVTITFKAGIEESNNNNDTDKRIEVYASNDPVIALSEFKPNFYDLLLVDINMPHINGFELCKKILAIDINVKVCFMSSIEINREALREIHPAISLGCFIRKPVTMDYLLKRIRSELNSSYATFVP